MLYRGGEASLYPVGIIVRAEQYEFDGVIWCFPAIRAGYDSIMPFFFDRLRNTGI